MKFTKIISGISAAALAVSVLCSIPTSAVTAGSTTVDFEDGDYSFVYMNVDSGADDSILSVEDYNGSKQLKCDVQDFKAVPKVWFDIYKMMDKANAVNINSIEFDLTLVPKNAAETVGWAGGAIGAAGSFPGQADPEWSQGDWSCDDENAYVEGAAASVHITRKFLLPTNKYTETSENPFFGLMRWAGETAYVMYFDNIVFYDADGNAITVGGAAATEEAAPAADVDTTSTATGNTAVAVMVSVMAVAAAAAAVATKKRK